ncbi:MAG: outer membrane lipoprotein carrier protein LolA [Bacteroidales bacterium]|nr:outer membrane lipoprotein carrier protein LolA [Bacteroidales bacterium]
MKKTAIILAAAALALFSIPSGAKSKTLGSFIDKVSSSLVTFDYSFTMQTTKSKTKMTGSGNVKVQGNAFFMEGNGMEVWCDGSTRWTIDRFAEEALVESVSESYDSYATNPALMITAVDDAFNEVSFGTSKFQGKAVDASVLSPVHKGKYSMDIAELTLFFKSGTSNLVGAEVKLNDGSVSEFSITGMTFSAQAEKKESFRFDEKTLDDSYVITDLR